jgi:hypothetical protein
VKLSNKLIDEVELNLVVMEENGDGYGDNYQDEEGVDPIIVFIAAKKSINNHCKQSPL